MIRILLFLFLLPVLLSSCGKNENVIGQFTVDMPVTVRAGLAPLKTHYFVDRDIKIAFEKYLETKNVSLDEVAKVEPSSALLTNITDNNGWGFVSKSSIYVFNPSEEKEEYLSYQFEYIPVGVGDELSMIPFMVDLKRLFVAPSIGVKVGLQLRNASPNTIQSVLRLRFNVVVE